MKKLFLIFNLAIFSLGISLCSLAADNSLSKQNIPPLIKNNASHITYQSDAKDFPEILKKFEEFAIKVQQELKVPGFALAVVQDDKIIYAKGFGVKKIDGPTDDSNKVNTHTLFEIGSMSKSFTATLVAMAIDEKKFSWDTRIIDLYPDFRMSDPWVTREFLVRDLMAQHSGLAPYAGDFLSMYGFDRNKIIYTLRYFKPVASFRSGYAYQNSFFVLADAILEKHTNKTWNQNIEQKIFKPLGMSESSTTTKALRQAANVSYLHMMRAGKPFAIPMNWSEDFDWLDVLAPAGGINSTVLDMTKWIRLQLHNGNFAGQQLVSIANLLFTRNPQTAMPLTKENSNDFGTMHYAMGWVFDTYHAFPILWHTGGTSGFTSVMGISPKTNTGIVILTNMRESALPMILMRTFFDLYFNHPVKNWKQDILAKKEKTEKEAEKLMQKPASPASSLPLDVYAGDYQSDVYGKITISVENNHLETTIGPSHSKFIFKPWDRDTFEMVWIGKEPGFAFDETKKILATFTINPAQEVTELSINLLDQADNCEPFKKVK